ncbi:MAG: PH domain-containing protein [Marmoricola sp.]
MEASTTAIASWTLIQEIPIPADVTSLLIEGEQAVAAYKTFRDSAIFTTKRLIVRDAQGLTGKKVEIYSLPYSNINMWSSENAGKLLDFNSELELWTRAYHIKIKLDKRVDIRRLDQLIAWAVIFGGK